MTRLMLDLTRPWEMTWCGAVIELRPAEWKLMRAVAERPGRLVTWSALYAQLWPGEPMAEPAQLYSHASRIRGKVRDALGGEEFDPLRTVPRLGLCLDMPGDRVEIRGGLPAISTTPRAKPSTRRPVKIYGRKSY